MTITFETVDVPTKGTAKDITENPYWPAVDNSLKTGKATKYTVPQEKDDTYEKVTQRVRGKLSEISTHLGRTVRATFEKKDDGSIVCTSWVLDKKIVRAKKDAETPTEAAKETPTEAAKETPTETAKETPTETAKETPTETAKETPTEAAKETPTEAAKETRRNRK